METEHDDRAASWLIAFEIAASSLHSVKSDALAGLNSMERLRAKLRPSSGQLEDLYRATECFERIIEHLGVLQRHRLPAPKPSDLNRIVQGAVATLRGRFGEIKIVESYADLPLLWLQPLEIRAILLSLLPNAIQAISEKECTDGVIGLGTAIDNARQIPMVTITVEDNGVGVAREEMPNLFTFGYTTREGATGTGLFISRRIAENHGGSISFESKPGRGARVIVSIPLKRYTDE
jgi:signal transduction histidine kinase